MSDIDLRQGVIDGISSIIAGHDSPLHKAAIAVMQMRKDVSPGYNIASAIVRDGRAPGVTLGPFTAASTGSAGKHSEPNAMQMMIDEHRGTRFRPEDLSFVSERDYCDKVGGVGCLPWITREFPGAKLGYFYGPGSKTKFIDRNAYDESLKRLFPSGKEPAKLNLIMFLRDVAEESGRDVELVDDVVGRWKGPPKMAGSKRPAEEDRDPTYRPTRGRAEFPSSIARDILDRKAARAAAARDRSSSPSMKSSSSSSGSDSSSDSD